MSKTYKILVAEDNELMLDLLAMEIRDVLEGADLTLVGDGISARNQAMAHPFDLIMSDNVMPGLLGSALLRELRGGQGPNSTTPFIFCSGNYSTDEIKGIKDCLVLQKPFDMGKFHTLLGRMLAL